jgi:hypothetical protein
MKALLVSGCLLAFGVPALESLQTQGSVRPQERTPAVALPAGLEDWARSRSRRPTGDPRLFQLELDQQILRFSAELRAMEVSPEYLIGMAAALAKGDAAEHQRQLQLAEAELREQAAEFARTSSAKVSEAHGREAGCAPPSAECPD